MKKLICLLALLTFVAAARQPLMKELRASGDVSTNATPSILYQVVFTGATVGDSMTVYDGPVSKLTLVTSVANEPVYWQPPADTRLRFTTDIAADLTKTGSAYATFVYEEL